MSESTKQREAMPALEKVLGVLSLVGPISVLAGMIWYGGRMNERLDHLAEAQRDIKQSAEKDHDVLIEVKTLAADIRERLLRDEPHRLSIGPTHTDR